MCAGSEQPGRGPGLGAFPREHPVQSIISREGGAGKNPSLRPCTPSLSSHYLVLSAYEDCGDAQLLG